MTTTHNSIISLPDYIKPNSFIPAHLMTKSYWPANIVDPAIVSMLTGQWPVEPYSTQFWSMDSLELYEKNKKLMPGNWEYHTTPVSYRFNSDGYRAPEFTTVDWENSVVIFGCSMVLGEGLPEEYTIASQLQEILGTPVINMGTSGGSMMFAYYNQLMLYEMQPNPVAVVNVWTDPERFCFFHQDRVLHKGNWWIDSDDLFSNTWNTAAQSYFIKRSAGALWKNIPYFECGFFPNSTELLNIKQLLITDKARDLMHPGKLSIKNGAEIIAGHLCRNK